MRTWAAKIQVAFFSRSIGMAGNLNVRERREYAVEVSVYFRMDQGARAVNG